LTEMRSRDSL
jgi:hypothetical protein